MESRVSSVLVDFTFPDFLHKNGTVLKCFLVAQTKQILSDIEVVAGSNVFKVCTEVEAI